MRTCRIELLKRDAESYWLRLFNQHETLFDTPLTRQHMDELLTLADERYRIGGSGMGEIGRRLYRLIDHEGRLSELRQRLQQPLALHFHSEGDLTHLPWELLHDGEIYLSSHPTHLFIPARRISPRCNDGTNPPNRPLHLLFMASSPTDVQPVLQFEQEEAAILETTGNQQIQLQVEESGSLAGLRERIEQWPEGAFDVVHLSGHADIVDDQPCFIMEDEQGQAQKVSALEIARTFSDSGRFPRLLFLSGCRTGQGVREKTIPSLCEVLVQAGVPAVLGWGLPVGDVHATEAARAIYQKLACGIPLDRAVANARQQLCEADSPYWHLLRLYCDETPLSPLVTPPKHPRRERLRPPMHLQRFLDARQMQVQVCNDAQFIGRRRLLQRSLTMLRGDGSQADGLLLQGMGGCGKSSAAARLAGRMEATHSVHVLYGGVDEIRLLNLLGEQAGVSKEILHDPKASLSRRLMQAFDQAEPPLLLIFDDFEQNVTDPNPKEGVPAYRQGALDLLHGCMHAIHEGRSECRVIVTCRYDVPLPSMLRWHREMPEVLRGADLRKKEGQLASWSDTRISEVLRRRAVELSAGNPRLLEGMDKLLQSEISNPETILDRMAQKQADFREEILLEALLLSLSRRVRRLLAVANLYELPLPAPSILAACGTEQRIADSADSAEACEAGLQRAARLGLIEHGEGLWFVPPLLDPLLQAELEDGERLCALQNAARHLDTALRAGGAHPPALLLEQETLRLALLAGLPKIARPLAAKMAIRARQQYSYHEALEICERALQLGEDFRLLDEKARGEMVLGTGSPEQDFARAVELANQIEGELSDEDCFAIASLNLANADLLARQGKIEEALHSLQQIVLPEFRRLGAERNCAVTMGKIADILQARGNLDEALRIRQQEQLPVYEKLGDVRSLLVGRTNLAILMLQADAKSHQQEIERLFNWSLTAALAMQLPEVNQIAGIMQKAGLALPTQEELVERTRHLTLSLDS
jgi:tetratricopeptide (TPR) repeat protein